MTKSDLLRPFLSVIIPAFNESRRLAPGLKQLREYFERRGLRVEVIVVDDGSSDDTADVAAAFDPGPMSLLVLRNRINRGKGYSVRRGIRRARGDVLLMADADQSTPIWEIEKFLPLLAGDYDVVIGSRDVAESHITEAQSIVRRLLGWLLRRLRGAIMLKDISDTQCGFKAFTRKAGKEIFSRVRTERFAFDCEVLLLARKLGYRVREVGVVWCNDADSRVHAVRDPIEMLISLIKIRWRLRHVGQAAGVAEVPRESQA